MGLNGTARPLIVSGYSSQQYAHEIAKSMDTRAIIINHEQFTDKEIKLDMPENIRGRSMIVVASAAGDPNKQEKEARLLLRAVGRSSPANITAVIPYMWYGRADGRFGKRTAPALLDTIETMRGLCDDVVVIDPHNHGFTENTFLDNGRVKTCETVHLAYPFAVQLKYLFNQKVITPESLRLLHPDSGAKKRIEEDFRRALYITLGLNDRDPQIDDWGIADKSRHRGTGELAFKGGIVDVRDMDVVLFEDMVASGRTACELAEILKAQGARSVILFATSGLFTPKEPEDIIELITQQLIKNKGKLTLDDPRGIVEFVLNATKAHIASSVERVNASQLDAVYIADTYDHALVDPEIHKAIQDSTVIHTLKTAPFIGAILSAMHAPVNDDEPELNSVSALLSGQHPSQANGGSFIQPVPIEQGSRLMGLRRSCP